MTRITTHPNPIDRPVPAFMVRAAIDDIEGGPAFEQLWTERVDEGLFKICCIPFFANDLALGDLVRAEPGTGYLIHPSRSC